jgi:hypothetical protein
MIYMDMQFQISHSLYRTIQLRFLHYVKGYIRPPAHRDNIVLKIKHSIRVEKEIEAIAIDIGMNDGGLQLAKIIGLLHDIARFEQYRRYETFVDRDSLDHGNFGIQIFHDTDILAGIDDGAKQIIEYAVSNHNQARLPENSDKILQRYAKLIRDADKLDIFRITCLKNVSKTKSALAGMQHLITPSEEISKAVCDAVRQWQPVDITQVKSYYDLILLRMAWVFDLNFKQSIERFQEKAYLPSLRLELPQNDMVDDLYHCIQRYLDQGPLMS